MPRIDEQYGDFASFDAVHAAQTNILTILSSNKKMDMKVFEVVEVLEKTHTAVKNDYQAYALFDTVMNTNTVFKDWINKLPQGQQLTFNKTLKTMLPPVDDHNQPIRSVDMKYQSEEYKQKTKSQWLSAQESAGLSGENLAVAELAEEFIRRERINISIAAQTPAVFFEYLNDNKVTQADKAILHQYLDLLSRQRTKYDQLQLHQLLKPEHSLESVVAGISQKYQSVGYTEYQNATEHFMPLVPKIQGIMSKYTHISSAPGLSVLTHQTAVTASYPVVFNRLLDAVKKTDLPLKKADLPLLGTLESSLREAQKRKAMSDAVYEFNQMMMKSSDTNRQSSALNHLLFSSDFSGPQDIYTQYHRGVLLENLLSVAFPDTFTTRGALSIKDKIHDAYQALGGSPEGDVPLEPAHFNKELLSRLGQNPAWVLLKAIKPIDEQFSLIDKVDAFHEIIQLAKDGKIKITEQGRFDSSLLKQAHPLAERLLTIVQERIKTHPEEDTQALRDHMQAIYETINTNRLGLSRSLSGITVVEKAYKDFNRQAFAQSHKLDETASLASTSSESSSAKESDKSDELASLDKMINVRRTSSESNLSHVNTAKGLLRKTKSESSLEDVTDNHTPKAQK